METKARGEGEGFFGEMDKGGCCARGLAVSFPMPFYCDPRV